MTNTVIVSCIPFFLFNKREKNYEAKLNKSYYVYEFKIKAIQNALRNIDTYLSWQITNNDNQKCPSREDINSTKLTMRFRESYNDLAVCCANVDIMSTYLKIIFPNKDTNVMVEYNNFRNLCRAEMELNTDIEFNKEHVFLSKITTCDLEENNNNAHDVPTEF